VVTCQKKVVHGSDVPIAQEYFCRKGMFLFNRKFNKKMRGMLLKKKTGARISLKTQP
jgi:hypothetical protein